MADISVMTEISAEIPSLESLPPAVARFVLHWGDMGTQWGVNRTIAQIHALLYITERPLNAEELASILGVARSNVSNSLKELLNWRIIVRVPVAGDRRDHFTAETDVWEMARRIGTVRKEREFDPAIHALSESLKLAETDSQVSEVQKQRLRAMHDFTTSLDHWHSQILRIPSGVLARLVKLGDKVVGMLGLFPDKARHADSRNEEQAP
jgi:DNA-binding transcriptional regulator GbsR (MarR family)